MQEFTSEQRVLDIHHHIDPGFINYRLCFSIFGVQLMQFFEENRKHNDDQLAKLFNNHLMVDAALAICNTVEDVTTLAETLQDPRSGMVFCSTEL